MQVARLLDRIPGAATPPLVVDLDGTLICSDLLLESALGYVRKNVLRSFNLLRWLIRGKARLKEQLAIASAIDVATLPYAPDVITLIKQERANGRTIVLATASHTTYADQIAEHLGLFDRVFGTSGATNLSGKAKRSRLIAEFGSRGFDYVGNSADDLPVWKSARYAYVVSSGKRLAKKASAFGNVEKVMPAPRATLKIWLKCLRVHQWIKNLLLLVPLLASHQVSVGKLGDGVFAFVLFGLCASSVYVLNDMLDLTEDRKHRSKRARAFACGALPLGHGLLAVPLLLLASLGGAFLLLPLKFVLALTSYYLITVAYSLYLKRLLAVDVLTLAVLYTMRIVAGTFAFDVSLTFWMLAFSVFIFYSLALVKRYAELLASASGEAGGNSRLVNGRGYLAGDAAIMGPMGAASGFLAVLVLALYIQEQSTAALYRNPEVIWLACPLLLFWISRTWLITHRGQMHDDPIVFALKDRVSQIVGVVFCLTFWAAV